MTNLKHVRAFVIECRKDIHFFVKHGLNQEPTWQQATVLDQVQAAVQGRPPPLPREPTSDGPGVFAGYDLGATEAASRQIADKSGQGPGKTTASTWIGLWRAIQRPGKLVVTAPTMRQCQEVWITECKKSLRNAHPYFQQFFEITATKVICGKDRGWAIHAITSTDEKKLQGFHDEGLTIICEEMSGIARGIIEQFQGTLSNADSMLLGIGNPNTRDCAFFDCFNSQRADWQTYTLNAEDTALYRPDILSPKRNQLLEKQYGRNSDIYRVRVLGEFPHADPNCVISSEELEKCIQAGKWDAAKANSIKSIAIDFSRMGGDESVIYRRRGNAIVEQEIFVHTEPADVTRAAFAMQIRAGWLDSETWYIPDAGGMGQGVLFMFYEAGKQVHEFHNGAKAFNQSKYVNKITEAWFEFADLARTQPISLPNDNRLIQQLCSRRYRIEEKTSRLVLETKTEYKKRFDEESPDRADAAIMAFYKNLIVPGRVARKSPNRHVMPQVPR